VNFVRDLHKHQRKQYSQNGEDGVLERLFDLFGATNRHYVELGTGSGEECNTRLLRERGWSGVMFDRDFTNAALSLHRELVTAENINSLFADYAIPEVFDLLSIDIDGNDYWIWKALSPRFQPRVAVIEYNAGIPADLSVVMPYEASFRWTGQLNCGQSLGALQKLSLAKGYSLVYAAPPNAFLVHSSLLPHSYREVSPLEATHVGGRAANRASHRRWLRELQQLAWDYV